MAQVYTRAPKVNRHVVYIDGHSSRLGERVPARIVGDIIGDNVDLVTRYGFHDLVPRQTTRADKGAWDYRIRPRTGGAR